MSELQHLTLTRGCPASYYLAVGVVRAFASRSGNNSNRAPLLAAAAAAAAAAEPPALFVAGGEYLGRRRWWWWFRSPYNRYRRRLCRIGTSSGASLLFYGSATPGLAYHSIDRRRRAIAQRSG